MLSGAASREASYAGLSLLFAFAGATLIVILGQVGTPKVLLGLAGATALIAAGYLMGNLRLFCLCLYMLTLPFDLSKRFGEPILKMGGESAFRIEMSDPFLLALAAYVGWEVASGKRPGLRIPRLLWFWFGVMAMGAVSAVFGDYHLTTAHELVRMLKMTVLFVVLVNELERPSQFMYAAAALAAGSIIQSLVGIAQYVRGRPLGLDLLGEASAATIEQLATTSVQSERVFRISAFLVHPNVFGVYLACLIPLAIGVFMLRTGSLAKAISILAVLLGMPALIGTLSRSGWASLAASFSVLLVLLFFHNGLRRRSFLMAAAATLALGLVVAVYAGPITRRLFSSNIGATLGRAEYNADAKRLIAVKPWFGWGLNTYVYVVPPYTRYGPQMAIEIYKGWVPAVHNIYLLWLAETGAVGCTLHILLMFSVLYFAFKNLRVRNQHLFVLNAVCIAAYAAFLVDGFFSFSLRINAISRLYWVLSAFVMAIHYWRRRQLHLGNGQEVQLPAGGVSTAIPGAATDGADAS